MKSVIPEAESVSALIGKHVYAGGDLNGIYGTIVGRHIDVDGWVWYDVKDDETGNILDFGEAELRFPRVKVEYT